MRQHAVTRDQGLPTPPLAAYADDPEAMQPLKFEPKAFILRDAAQIPPRQHLYSGHLIRGFVSTTVASGGLGKSSMITVEALAMTTGRNLLGHAPPKPLRVWCWNGEDPHEELERRIAAACLHYGITAADLADRLMVDSGRDVPITLAAVEGQQIRIAKPTADALVAAIRDNRVDVLVVDPFVTSHQVPENDNTAVNAVVAEWRRIAAAASCAIELVHHVSKAGAMSGDDFGIYAARGAGALIDGVRSARYLVRMRQEEAERYGIQDPASYFRVNTGKANLAPLEKATWRRMIGISLGNGADLWPQGDEVGVCVPWSPPDAFEGLTIRDLKRVQSAVAACADPPKENERGVDWVGGVVADVLGLDIGRGLKKVERSASQNMARAKVRQLLNGWLRSGALKVEQQRSPRDGRDVKVVTVGEPVTSEDARAA